MSEYSFADAASDERFEAAKHYVFACYYAALARYGASRENLGEPWLIHLEANERFVVTDAHETEVLQKILGRDDTHSALEFVAKTLDKHLRDLKGVIITYTGVRLGLDFTVILSPAL